MKIYTLLGAFFEKIFKNYFFTFLFFTIFSIMVFHPSLLNNLFFWDDERFIFLNPSFLNAASWTDFWNFDSFYYKTWSLGYSIFWMLHKFLSIENLFTYKVINIVFHSLNGLLVFIFLKKSKLPFYVLLSLIFLLHPLHVENVSWIFQLLTIVSFTFFLLSLLCIKNYLDFGKRRFIFLSFIFFIFSLLTKSIALLAPFFFLACFLINKASFKKSFFLIPFFIASLFIGVLNLKGTENLSGTKSGKINSYFKVFTEEKKKSQARLNQKQLNTQSFFEFIYLKKNAAGDIKFNQPEIFSQGINHYFSSLILPINQQFIYPVLKIPIAWSLILSILIMLGFLKLYINSKNKKFILIFIYLFIFIIPYLGVTFITFFYWSNVSDRYTYFLIPGFVFFIGLVIKEKKLYQTLLSAYLFMLIMLAVNYSYKFNNPLRLYQEIITYKKHPAIYSLLFEQYLIIGDLKKGEATILEGASKFPNDELLRGDLLRLEGLKMIYK